MKSYGLTSPPSPSRSFPPKIALTDRQKKRMHKRADAGISIDKVMRPSVVVEMAFGQRDGSLSRTWKTGALQAIVFHL